MSAINLAGMNGHNEAEMVSTARALFENDYSAVVCMESQRAFADDPLDGMARTTVAGRDWTEERNRARSTRILTRRSRPNIGEYTRLVSEKIQPYERIAPDRVLVASLFEHPLARELGRDGFAVMGIHPDAGGVLRDRGERNHPLVREYREAMISTRKAAKMFRSDGLIVVIFSDAQMPAGVEVPWSPERMLVEPLDMGHLTRNLDWMFYDRVLEVRNHTFERMHDHWLIRARLGAASR
jgi:hypothetical protein